MERQLEEVAPDMPAALLLRTTFFWKVVTYRSGFPDPVLLVRPPAPRRVFTRHPGTETNWECRSIRMVLVKEVLQPPEISFSREARRKGSLLGIRSVDLLVVSAT